MAAAPLPYAWFVTVLSSRPKCNLLPSPRLYVTGRRKTSARSPTILSGIVLDWRKERSPCRIFRRAHPKMPVWCTQSAWVDTNTTFIPATKHSSGTNSTQQCQNETTSEPSSSRRTTHHYASTGIASGDAKPPRTLPNTSAQGVAPLRMEPRAVLELRTNHALSPYRPDAWEKYLAAAGLPYKYAHIVQGLRTGFKIDFPLITFTQTPSNRPSTVE